MDLGQKKQFPRFLGSFGVGNPPLPGSRKEGMACGSVLTVTAPRVLV